MKTAPMRIANIALGTGDGGMKHASVSEWRAAAQRLSSEGYTAAIVDVADGFAYPSHPELAAKGAWDAKTFRAEIGRLRDLGLEPIPCLDFSAGRCAWIGKPAGTAEGLALCLDLVKDVHRVFGHPRYFQVVADGWSAPTASSSARP